MFLIKKACKEIREISKKLLFIPAVTASFDAIDSKQNEHTFNCKYVVWNFSKRYEELDIWARKSFK